MDFSAPSSLGAGFIRRRASGTALALIAFLSCGARWESRKGDGIDAAIVFTATVLPETTLAYETFPLGDSTLIVAEMRSNAETYREERAAFLVEGSGQARVVADEHLWARHDANARVTRLTLGGATRLAEAR